ncbi:hypothetical protein EMCRGX_G024053 [Ephydatia muelleri]
MAPFPVLTRLLVLEMQSVAEYEYSKGDLIGHGAFAVVFKGRHKQTLETVAIKQISLKMVPSKVSNIRQKEISILRELKHPNIVRLFGSVETEACFFLIMEYCNGGDLGDYLQAKKTLSEDSIRHLAKHVAGALGAIHAQNIVHRDIKPQNLLLCYPNNRKDGSSVRDHIRDATIKLADFGFARHLMDADMAATLCGSPLYMAPEILLSEKYDSKADLWSVGTILFQCLAGMAPFMASNPRALRKRYEKESLVPRIPDGTSHLLNDLLIKLLKKIPKERIGHDGFIAHPFLQESLAAIPPGLVEPEQPSRAKSQPVPIKRNVSVPPSHCSSAGSSHHHVSPGSSSVGSPRDYLSSSSVPPVMQKAGSGSSTPQCVEGNEGWTVIGSNPGQSKSSLSPHSNSSRVSHSGSVGRASFSYGSIPPILTTPFYQPSGGMSSAPSHPLEAGPGVGPGSRPDSTPDRRMSEPLPFSSHTPLNTLINLHQNNASSRVPSGSSASPHQHRRPSNNPQSPKSQGGRNGTSLPMSPGKSPSSVPKGPSSGGRLAALTEGEIPAALNPVGGAGESRLIYPSPESAAQTPSPDQNRGIVRSSPNRSTSCDPSTHRSKWSRELDNIRRRANSLATLEHMVDLPAGPYTPTETRQFDLSPTATIKPLFGAFTGVSLSEKLQESSFRTVELEETGEEASGSLRQLQQSLELAKGIIRMANARQGPIMLLSTDILSSGEMSCTSHMQRCSEQMVLLAKAYSILDAALRPYVFDQALTNTEPSQELEKVELETKLLQRTCLEKARHVQKVLEYLPEKEVAQVSAEKLLFLEALDKCKTAVLDEQRGEKKECLKRYRIAKQIFELLLSDAKSERDKRQLECYIAMLGKRLQNLN